MKCRRWEGSEGRERRGGGHVPVMFTDTFLTFSVHSFGDVSISCIFGYIELKYFNWKMSDACMVHTRFFKEKSKKSCAYYTGIFGIL